MTTESNSTQVEKGAFYGMNPYLIALAWIWIPALTAAGIIFLIGVDQSSKSLMDPFAGVEQFAWSNALGGLGLVALFTWLLANALLWKGPPRGAE